jgi:hypothetical protein
VLRRHIAEDDGRVGAAAENRQIGGQFTHPRRARHLVEQRLEDMMIVAVNEGEPDGGPAQAFRGQEPGKPATHDDHVGAIGHRRIVSRRQRAKAITSSSGGTAFSSP